MLGRREEGRLEALSRSAIAAWARVRAPAILLSLGLFAVYELAAFWDLRADRPVFRETLGNVFWPVTWKMFTGYTRRQSKLEFQGLERDAWRPLPMEEWYPMEWESGPRWERPRVRRSRSTQAIFLDAACKKANVSTVRLVVYSWPKHPGRYEPEPTGRARMRTLATRSCGVPLRRAPARVL